MAATVSLPVFEGPIDLLLQLINSHQVDIYDVPLAEMVDAFVAEVATWEAVDLSTLSEFLVVAAVLVELKSKRLLPGPDDVEADEELSGWEERDLLLARLLECQAYSAAADAFTLMMEYASRSVPRQAGLDDGFAVHAPDLLEGVTPNHLMAAYLRATAARPAPVVDLYHVTVDTVSVAEAVSELEVRLPRVGTATFRGLTRHLTTRMEVIVRFLALLELCKQGRVALDQWGTFGDLEVTWVTGAPTTVSVGAVDYEYEG
ncbi:MAG TPA: ScpA family protein [Acidimicrobiales bacterium]